MSPRARRSKAGGAKKRPTRYASPANATDHALAIALRDHRKGEFARAAAGYREILAHDPDSIDACMNLGALCVLAGLAREASAVFARAAAIAPGNARVHRD